jgi:hypothetical protein
MATFRAVGFRAITFTLIFVIPNSLRDYPNFIVALENYRVKQEQASLATNKARAARWEETLAASRTLRQ